MGNQVEHRKEEEEEEEREKKSEAKPGKPKSTLCPFRDKNDPSSNLSTTKVSTPSPPNTPSRPKKSQSCPPATKLTPPLTSPVHTLARTNGLGRFVPLMASTLMSWCCWKKVKVRVMRRGKRKF
jgi:hypothetical protein